MKRFNAGELEYDPVYEYVFRNKMEPFVQWAKEWWSRWEDETFYETGSYPAVGAPAGMFIRFSRTIAHSPVHGVQAFPYVSVPFLQMHHVPGGVRKLIDKMCHDGITMEGFKLIERKYLHGTERNGQFVCIVPEKLAEEGMHGKYVWLCTDDLISLASGAVDRKMRNRFRYLAGGNNGKVGDREDDREEGEDS